MATYAEGTIKEAIGKVVMIGVGTNERLDLLFEGFLLKIEPSHFNLFFIKLFRVFIDNGM